ncbi:MAG: restriction endonuclease subunit S, partial [Flavobacterium sp.]
MNGTTRLKLTQGRLREIPVTLPPLAEQHRIVAKLEAVLARVANCKSRLEKIPVLLKNFRQSVLAAAVSGELTKEWRINNKDVQPWKIKTNKKERKNVLDDKVDDYELFEIPSYWRWSTISDVAEVKGGKRIPKGHKLVSYNTGLPYIKAGDLKKGTVLKDKLEFLLPETQKLIKRYTVEKGDVYLTNVGAKIGDAGVVPDNLHGANLTENALKMCNLEGVINQYLSFWLQSPIAQEFIQQTILSAAQGKLALGRVEVFPLPLAPLQEQKEIVSKVEKLFHFADSIEERYHKAKAWFDKIPQAILAKAFRGQLIP